jgi:hypothetical protein
MQSPRAAKDEPILGRSSIERVDLELGAVAALGTTPESSGRRVARSTPRGVERAHQERFAAKDRREGQTDHSILNPHSLQQSARAGATLWVIGTRRHRRHWRHTSAPDRDRSYRYRRTRGCRTRGRRRYNGLLLCPAQTHRTGTPRGIVRHTSPCRTPGHRQSHRTDPSPACSSVSAQAGTHSRGGWDCSARGTSGSSLRPDSSPHKMAAIH